MKTEACGTALERAVSDWGSHANAQRLWQADATLWTGTDEGRWLGWLRPLEITDSRQVGCIVEDVRTAGFEHILVLGMGGSSLCAQVLHQTFGVISEAPALHVLDSTVPAQIAAMERRIEIAKTLFIVASKSGTTVETDLLRRYFFDRVRRAVGSATTGSRFVAITDPETPLQTEAKSAGFRHLAFGIPTIGGRFSALSHFGMLPAGLMGIDVDDLLARAESMARQCAPSVPTDRNPGVMLGLRIGTMAQSGRDKLTLLTSPGLMGLGLWLEQLVAESTGKDGLGIVPIAGEQLDDPAFYGDDRLFVDVRLRSDPLPSRDEETLEALQQAGHPLIRIWVDEPMDLGQEFFRWEMAVAVASSLLGINPFTQPDVDASKTAARKLTDRFEETGEQVSMPPLLEEDGLRFFAAPTASERFEPSHPIITASERFEPPHPVITASDSSHHPIGVLATHLVRLSPGDYFAVNAYIEQTAEVENTLQALRHAVRDSKKVATSLGFGPRFLHSTGQLQKGGSNTGLFLQVTGDDPTDVKIAGTKLSFGVLKQAQAQGDFKVLAERGRRLLWVHVGGDLERGLIQLRRWVEEALTAGPECSQG